MKLNEITDLDDDWESSDLAQNIPRSMKRKINTLRSSPDHVFVGSGSNAYVGREDTPHTLDTVSRISYADDGSATYLNYIYRRKLDNNPYFPKVMAKPRGRSFVTHIVERLYPFDTYQDNELLLRSMWNKWFTIQYPRGKNIDIGMEVVKILSKVLDEAIPDTTIKDQQLLQALTVIQHIADDTTKGHYIDLQHTDNIMWRMTGKMPQLVITDPLV